MQQQIVIIGGPTASGKTALAIDVARKIDAVIINADSQQVYREIPILTAQPSLLERQEISHRLYGIISASEYFSVASWLELVEGEIKQAFEQGKTPLLVGGTGMYIKSLIEGIAQVPEISDEIRVDVRQMCEQQGAAQIHKLLAEKDPQMAAKLNPADKQRVLRALEVYLQTGKSLLHWQAQKTTPLFSAEKFGMFCLFPDRKEVYDRCNARFINMLENGGVDEVHTLKNMNIPQQMPAMNALGVPELLAYDNGTLEYNAMLEIAQQKTRNYVKRQFTFFRNQMQGRVIEAGSDITADSIITALRARW